MSKVRIRKGDVVKVLAGKDKGRTGKVLSIVRKLKAKKGKRSLKLKKEYDVFAIVENINIAKKHVRGNPQQDKPGGIIPREMPIRISNIALFNAAENKGEKLGMKFLEDGTKVRCFRSSGEVVDD